MGRPGTTPKPATPPSPSRGRPGAVKVPYLLDDHASDLLLIDPVVVKPTVTSSYQEQALKLAAITGKSIAEIKQLIQAEIEGLSGLIDVEEALVIITKNLGYNLTYLEDSYQNHLAKTTPMVDLKLTQTAAEFESIVDSHYPDKSTTPYPPAGKVPDPLETQLDTELGLNPTPVTLAELDGILSLFLTENRSLDGLPMATPANRDAFYQRQRHVGDIKAKQINMQTHWRAQQDLLNREAMLQLAKALQK